MGEAVTDVNLLVCSRSIRKHAVRLCCFFFLKIISTFQIQGQGNRLLFLFLSGWGEIFWLYKATFSWNNPEKSSDLQQKPFLVPPKALLSHPPPPTASSSRPSHSWRGHTVSQNIVRLQEKVHAESPNLTHWVCGSLCDVSRGQTARVVWVWGVKGQEFLLPPQCLRCSTR